MKLFSREPNALNDIKFDLDREYWHQGWSTLSPDQRGPDPRVFDPNLNTILRGGINTYAPTEETMAMYRVLTNRGTPEDEVIMRKSLQRNRTRGDRCPYCSTLSAGNNCQNCGAPR